MFAKRTKRSSQQQSPTDDGSQTAQSGPDPHATDIERLELELEEQRTLAKTLRESLDAATFKIEILEKSYAKQLAEVRDKRAANEAELQEKNEILANLGGGHEHTLRELNDALTVIKVLKTERDQLRKQIAEGGFRKPSETKARALLGSSDDSRRRNGRRLRRRHERRHDQRAHRERGMGREEAERRRRSLERSGRPSRRPRTRRCSRRTSCSRKRTRKRKTSASSDSTPRAPHPASRARSTT